MSTHYKRDSYLNESANQNQNENPRFYKGGSFRHYQDNARGEHRVYPFSASDDDAWTQRESRSRDGTHAGKGPKFYRRPDERIKDDVCHALTEDDQVDASEIEVKVEGGFVTLSGTVYDRQMKRFAEACIDHIPGIHDIQNNLLVEKALQIKNIEASTTRKKM